MDIEQNNKWEAPISFLEEKERKKHVGGKKKEVLLTSLAHVSFPFRGWEIKQANKQASGRSKEHAWGLKKGEEVQKKSQKRKRKKKKQERKQQQKKKTPKPF